MILDPSQNYCDMQATGPVGMEQGKSGAVPGGRMGFEAREKIAAESRAYLGEDSAFGSSTISRL